MRERLTEFVQRLRAAGVRVSIAETLDAMAAVRKAGIDPTVLRESLAATLVKDELDRDRFDAAFEEFFAAPPRAGIARGRRGKGAIGGEPAADAGRGGGTGAGGAAPRRPEAEPSPPSPAARPAPPRQPPQRPSEAQRPAVAPAAVLEAKPREGRETQPRPAREDERRPAAATRGEAERERRATGADRGRERATPSGRPRRGDPRELLRKPLTELSPDELEDAATLARELGKRFAARASRRERRLRTGRVDVRRTIRSSLSRGGAMLVLERRGRRPGKPRLVVLCDVSGSVARATDVLLAIVAAAESAFRRVTRFAYVDHLVPVAFEGGHLLPEGELDLWARSDFGTVLRELEERHADRLDRSTVLLILGDARNNRLPPRADVLKRLATRVRAVVWAVAEPRARWDTGDSALAAYVPACDLVAEATTLEGLLRVVRASARR